MFSPLTIIRQRRNRHMLSRDNAEGRALQVGFAFGFIASVLAALLTLALALFYADLVRGLPPITSLSNLLDPMSGFLLQPTRLYDRTGQHLLATLAPSETPRQFIPIDPQASPHLPQALVDATIALVEPDFWNSPGYVFEGWNDPESHPTIAQKLVSDLLLWNESPTPRRALRERVLAAQITARYGRRQVLEWYLNSADYGHYAYGANAAARLYFGKTVDELGLGESAMLASVGQAPALNPLDASQAAAARRDETLNTMQSLGMIKETSYPITPFMQTKAGETVPAFVNLVLDQFSKTFPRSRLERGGLNIFTTLDYDLQLQVSCVVKTQLARLAGDFSEQLTTDGSSCDAARLLPALPPGLSQLEALASALVLDPRTGQVLAVIGETDSPHLAARPAGTLLTPFIYLTGFTRGLSPASLTWGIPGSSLNPDDAYHGPVRLRIALANDYRPPAAQVLGKMGEENVHRILQSFGLAVPVDGRLLEEDVPLSMLNLAAAYGIFANQGIAAGQLLAAGGPRPVTVLKIEGVDHALWADWSQPQVQAVVSPGLAYLMNHVLSDETARWPSQGHPNPLEIGRPAGAKLGLSFDGKNAWVAGYTPQRVVIVWMGAGDENVNLSRLSGDLWHALMQYTIAGLPVEYWAAPQGIVQVDVCDPSGMLPTSICPNVVSEVFLAENEPVQVDTLYRAFQVNRETGYLATVFTPPELVEARVYMVVPQEAKEWAETSSLPTPPEAYDTIQSPPVLPDVHITTPAMFAGLRGTVEVMGTASGADFSYYRLEYGKGLNPQSWVQIGTNVNAPVEEEILGTWDTSSLDGLYALRLLVVRGDARVESAVILVSLVNP